jgi:hypothetical protein
MGKPFGALPVAAPLAVAAGQIRAEIPIIQPSKLKFSLLRTTLCFRNELRSIIVTTTHGEYLLFEMLQLAQY